MAANQLPEQAAIPNQPCFFGGDRGQLCDRPLPITDQIKTAIAFPHRQCDRQVHPYGEHSHVTPYPRHDRWSISPYRDRS